MTKRTNNKKITNILCSIYYVFLVGVITTKIIQTVYAGSLFVHRSVQLQSLNREKQILLEKNYDLTTQISEKNSLHSLISSATLDEYSKISDPIVINNKTVVALK